MPHSTQMRTRCVGSGEFDVKSRFRNDIRVSRDTLARRGPYGTRGDRVTPPPESACAEEAFLRSADPEKGWDVEDDGHVGHGASSARNQLSAGNERRAGVPKNGRPWIEEVRSMGRDQLTTRRPDVPQRRTARR